MLIISVFHTVPRVPRVKMEHVERGQKIEMIDNERVSQRPGFPM
jgi:hypothetical protein